MSQGNKFWLWVRRLVLYPLAVGFSFMLGVTITVTIALVAPDCRIARVVLASGAHPDTHINLSVHYGDINGGPDLKKVLWDGPFADSGPILIPFGLHNEGGFRIEVKYPGEAEPRVKEAGYIAGLGSTHYFFVGKKEIGYDLSIGGVFANQREIAIFGLPAWIVLMGTDRLSCMDGS